MNGAALLDPAVARAVLPAKSRERALASLALRQLWHAVFDPCPKLMAGFPPDGKTILEPFLAHAGAKGLSMGWPLHAHLLLWLRESGRAEVPGARVELLAAAAANWAVSDQTPDRGVLIHHAGGDGESVAAWKSGAILENHRVVRIRPASLPDASSGIFYAACPAGDYPARPDWRPLPF